MATRSVTTCDRCGDEAKEKEGSKIRLSHRRSTTGNVVLSGTNLDLCGPCERKLYQWLSDGSSRVPVGYKEIDICTHYVPCAGPCETKLVPA